MEATVLLGPGPKARPRRAQGDRHNIQSVDRALYLLETIAEAGGEATLTELATRTNLNISTCWPRLSNVALQRRCQAAGFMHWARAFSTSDTPVCRSIYRAARSVIWKRSTRRPERPYILQLCKVTP